jgi:hypothetical protein
LRKPLRSRTWAATGRDPDDVLDAALAEFDQGSPGASAFELAAVASHHLTVHGALGTQEPGSHADVRRRHTLGGEDHSAALPIAARTATFRLDNADAPRHRAAQRNGAQASRGFLVRKSRIGLADALKRRR